MRGMLCVTAHFEIKHRQRWIWSKMIDIDIDASRDDMRILRALWLYEKKLSSNDKNENESGLFIYTDKDKDGIGNGNGGEALQLQLLLQEN